MITELPKLLMHADTLLHARWVLPMHAGGDMLEHQILVITNGVIVDMGPSHELMGRYMAGREHFLDHHVVMPGFINAHGHSPMTLLRGYADDLPLQPWLEQKIWPAESRWLSEDYVAAGARLAVAEMLLSGTTTFTDMYFHADVVGDVVNDSGIRAQLSSPVFDFPTTWARSADEYITKATKLFDQYSHHERITIAFGPHAPYTVSDEPLRKIAMLSEELDACIHMHVHENAQEITDAMQKQGMRPLRRLKQLELIGPRLQCVHMTQLLDDEIAMLRDMGAHVIHCPASNLKLASGICRTADLLAAGVNVALGTDGSASNNSLDMLSELRLAALLAKGAGNDASLLPARQALTLATANGAKALGLENKIGCLQPGKQADIIAIDLKQPRTQPVYDPCSTIVYSAASSQVSHVWVDGEMLVADHKLTRMNVEQVLEEAKRWGAGIAAGALEEKS
ncbi:MAG: TRZ/ATZ family hydrolase [Pseudomonadota bacterium]